MTDLIARLEAAIDGLRFPSESDEALRVFVWDDPAPFSPEALLAEAEAFQARANTLRALAAIRQEDARDADNR